MGSERTDPACFSISEKLGLDTESARLDGLGTLAYQLLARDSMSNLAASANNSMDAKHLVLPLTKAALTPSLSTK
jgi:hypothetical protein